MVTTCGGTIVVAMTGHPSAMPAPGERFGAYAVDAVIGEGGAAVVARAHGAAAGAALALKVAKPATVRDPVVAKRFTREAATLARVDHPHVMRVLDHGEVDGTPYLVMPLMAGTLHDRLRDGPVAIADVVRIVRQVAAGLDALHDAGIIHRDVKPANILFDAGGAAVVGDLGVARAADMSALTRADHVIGTMDYMAPEQIRGEEPRAASDTYALGCVAHEMIAGRPPFAGRGLFEVAFGHLDDEPPGVTADRPDAPADLDDAVRLALAKEPAARPPTTGVFARLLAVAATGTVGPA